MKNRLCLKLTLILVVVAGLSFGARVADAATIGFHVTVSTSSLIGNGSAPFALDFQLNGGNPLGNTATISNFNFGGGSPSSTPPANLFGLGSGSLASSVTLADNSSNFLNEFFQGFNPGASLGFDVLLTTNVNSPTPDTFSFAILDKNLLNIPAPGLGDSFLIVNLNSTAPRVQAFSGTGTFSSVGASVPEAEPVTLLAVGMIGLGLCILRLKRSQI